jgi:hypothetical protein
MSGISNDVDNNNTDVLVPVQQSEETLSRLRKRKIEPTTNINPDKVILQDDSDDDDENYEEEGDYNEGDEGESDYESDSAGGGGGGKDTTTQKQEPETQQPESSKRFKSI